MINDKHNDSALVSFSGLTKSYGDVTAVHPLDLEIQRGEFLAILGPSGCGKSTLLRMIGGFVQPTGGKILLNKQDVTRVSPEHRPTNMVFQGYGLFPHMTVAQNVAYGLNIQKTPKDEVKSRVAETMDLVHLGEFGDRMIGQLSGGQCQRVALARALVMRPEVLLLDEPLGALDLQLRKSVREELRRIHTATGGTFVFVTHDQEEAMALASRICVMAAGRVIQDGPPEEIYSSPKSHFVSTFIGEANVLHGRRTNNVTRINGDIHFPDQGSDGNIVCVVRPDKMHISPSNGQALPDDLQARVSGTLCDAVFLGPYIKYTVKLAGGQRLAVESRDFSMRKNLVINSTVNLAWRWEDQRTLAEEQ